MINETVNAVDTEKPTIILSLILRADGVSLSEGKWDGLGWDEKSELDSEDENELDLEAESVLGLEGESGLGLEGESGLGLEGESELEIENGSTLARENDEGSIFKVWYRPVASHLVASAVGERGVYNIIGRD
ncbi:MAG: hypothetical protein LQ351_001726 [Letrouitia transgressa]|nr:MAG: hypothetical protein LQ351_001726 [Letrouitia transgressa]